METIEVPSLVSEAPRMFDPEGGSEELSMWTSASEFFAGQNTIGKDLHAYDLDFLKCSTAWINSFKVLTAEIQ